MKKIALFGYSGHGYVVAEAALLNDYRVAGYYDFEEALFNPFSLSYLGFEQEKVVLENIHKITDSVALGMGNNTIRKKIFSLLQQQELSFPIIKHPATIVSEYAFIAQGTVIAAGAVINPVAEIGTGVILNTGCLIEHECKIGDFSHIAPGATLAGNVSIGENSFVGANAVIKQGITIGANVVIGAGSVVLRNISDNEVWAGNPAKRLQK